MSTPLPDTPLVIEARGLHKTFRDFWGRPKVHAVRDLSLDIRQGEVFGLLGPNGSGKSTTIKMILGLLYPTRGELRVMGRSPRDVTTRAHIGFMPEESYLYKYLTAAETLDFYAGLSGLTGPARRQRVDELIELLGLTAARRRRVGEFSKGMARRVGLAQALIHDPDLILLDEPTSGLDPIACRQVKDLIVSLARRGKTVLVCSHHLADMEDVCDRVAILLNGRACAQGTVRDLVRRPHTWRLTLDNVEPAQLDRMVAYLEAQCGHPVAVESAGRSLESLFIEVVTGVADQRDAKTEG
jgi:ABC-2 type transport system ATP-binding protein